MATNIRINYDVIFNELIQVRKEIDKLQKENDVLIDKNKKLGDSFNRLDQQTKKTSGNLGGLKNNLVQLGAAFGITSGIFLFANAIRNAGRSVVDFQKNNAVLAGVLNTTREGVSRLTKDAERLGSSTAKTASQVTELQIALARLGFSQQEIINLTEPLINGSIALNANLAETAELVGAVVRTFDDFDTIDAPEIIDKLTVSTQRSALSFGKLQTALPIVAGAANAAGVDLSRLLALLGKLADAGIDTSTSATSLRNIFIDASTKGLSYSEILDKIANASDQLTASTDEFGRRTAVSASVISNQLEALDDLEEAINKAGGTAERVANEQLNTLSGQIDLLTSAWEGFIFSLDNGDGVISDVAKTTIQLFTNLLSGLSNIEEFINGANFAEKAKEYREEQNLLALAQIQYNSAIDAGITTFKEYNEILGKNIEDQELLNQIQKLFNDEVDQTNKNIESQIPIIQTLKEELKQEVELRDKATSEDEIRKRNIRIEQIKEEIQRLMELNNEVEKGINIIDRLDGKSADFLTTYEQNLKNVQKAAREAFGDPLAERAEQSLKKVGNSIDNFLEDKKEKDEEELEQEREKQKRKEEIIAASINAISQVSSNFFQTEANNARRNFELLETYKQQELELAGDNADQRAKIEAKFAQKAAEFKRKESVAEKRKNIFEAIINTASAVVQALPNIPLSIIVGGIGAAQTAAIASQPIPKFRQGGKVGGKRHEQGGTLIEAEKDEFVLRREAVQKYGLPMIESLNNLDLSPNLVVVNDTRELAKVWKERPENRFTWDENGFTVYQNRKNNFLKQKAKRYSL